MAERVERWEAPDLAGRVALVAGASYGVGRAVAEVLGECGATVYVTARSTASSPTRDPRWTVEETAALVEAAGGTAVPVGVDHTQQREVEELARRIEGEHGRLDMLVNNVWQWGPKESYWAPTSDQPAERWDAMFGVGARSAFVTTAACLRPLQKASGGLIVTTQERPGGAQHFAQNIVVDAAVAAMARMTEFLGHELRDSDVTAVLLYFGWVRTVNLGMGFDREASAMSEEQFRSVTQSPHFVGRAIAALAADPDRKARSGKALEVGRLALELGFTDVDGRVPGHDGRDLLDEPAP